MVPNSGANSGANSDRIPFVGGTLDGTFFERVRGQRVALSFEVATPGDGAVFGREVYLLKRFSPGGQNVIFLAYVLLGLEDSEALQILRGLFR